MRPREAVAWGLLLAVALCGCAGLGGWLGEAPDAPGTVAVPGGTQVVVPEGGGSVTQEIDGVGTVTVTPGATAEPTRGSVLADGLGGIAGTLTGNPMAAVAVAALGKLLLAKTKRKEA